MRGTSGSSGPSGQLRPRFREEATVSASARHTGQSYEGLGLRTARVRWGDTGKSRAHLGLEPHVL